METDIKKIHEAMLASIVKEFPYDHIGMPWKDWFYRDGEWFGEREYSNRRDTEDVMLRMMNREELIIVDCYEKIIALGSVGSPIVRRHVGGLFRSKDNLLR